jgi:hypothetical protein
MMMSFVTWFSAALRVTEAAGICTLRDEYDINGDAGGEDDSEWDAASMMANFVTLLAYHSE